MEALIQDVRHGIRSLVSDKSVVLLSILVAKLLAAVGVYGVLSCLVSRRTREPACST